MKIVLAVKAEKFEVDLVAGCLRVNGKNIKENKYVKVQYEISVYLAYDRVIILFLAWKLSYVRIRV